MPEHVTEQSQEKQRKCFVCRCTWKLEHVPVSVFECNFKSCLIVASMNHVEEVLWLGLLYYSWYLKCLPLVSACWRVWDIWVRSGSNFPWELSHSRKRWPRQTQVMLMSQHQPCLLNNLTYLYLSAGMSELQMSTAMEKSARNHESKAGLVELQMLTWHRIPLMAILLKLFNVP